MGFVGGGVAAAPAAVRLPGLPLAAFDAAVDAGASPGVHALPCRVGGPAVPPSSSSGVEAESGTGRLAHPPGGAARVGTFFLVRDRAGHALAGGREAAFRGRALVGTDVVLPEGYGVAAVMRGHASGPRRTEDLGDDDDDAGAGGGGGGGGALSGDQVTRWDAVSRAYPSFASWTHDGAAGTAPNAAKAAAEWLPLAAAVHRQISADAVDAAI